MRCPNPGLVDWIATAGNNPHQVENEASGEASCKAIAIIKIIINVLPVLIFCL
jgi:hypothetical protein